MSKIIGIDLGTTNSVVAIMEGKEPKIITNEEGGRTTPSVVAFGDNDEVLVGQIARRQAITNPENTVYSIKRFMGMKHAEIRNEVERVPYELIRHKNGDAHVKVRDKTFAPPEISAKILQKLKRAAEDYLGEKVTEAVITVPAYFNDSQRQATKDAGEIAGLQVRRIVNEPTAAALAYGLDKEGEKLVAVYDFGGGTFDISILEVAENVVEVLSTNGDTHLGGDDIDQELMQWLIAEFKKDQGLDVGTDKMVLQRLKEAAEKAKIELSTAQETEINLPFLTADASGPKHLQTKLTRAKFEQMVGQLVERTIRPCEMALKDAKKSASDINEVILVGGSTRMPLVQEKVSAFFGRDPHKGVNPDEVVALGAAVQAGVLAGDVKDILLLDVTPLSLGIETLGSEFTVLIPRNTTIPHKKSDVFTTAADNQPSVEVHVLQGERPLATQNRTLGKFHLDGIPPAPRRVPQIEVTFDIDANGILNVSATDKATGNEQKITITASSGLTDEDIDRMKADAEANEAEDDEKRRQIQARNKLDGMIYGLEKSFEESKDKLPEDEVATIREKLEAGKKLLENDAATADEMEAALEDIQSASHKMAEKLYAAAGGPEGGAPDGGMPGGVPGDPNTGGAAGDNGKPKDDGAIDADFEEVK